MSDFRCNVNPCQSSTDWRIPAFVVAGLVFGIILISIAYFCIKRKFSFETKNENFDIENGEILGKDEVGEILAKTPTIMKGEM